MLDLVPREVADVYETLDSLLELSEYAEVSDIANRCRVLLTNSILLTDVLPWVSYELLETK